MKLALYNKVGVKMKQTLKHLRINKDAPSFIVAATELKAKSKKR